MKQSDYEKALSGRKGDFYRHTKYKDKDGDPILDKHPASMHEALIKAGWEKVSIRPKSMKTVSKVKAKVETPKKAATTAPKKKAVVVADKPKSVSTKPKASRTYRKKTT